MFMEGKMYPSTSYHTTQPNFNGGVQKHWYQTEDKNNATNIIAKWCIQSLQTAISKRRVGTNSWNNKSLSVAHKALRHCQAVSASSVGCEQNYIGSRSTFFARPWPQSEWMCFEFVEELKALKGDLCQLQCAKGTRATNDTKTTTKYGYWSTANSKTRIASFSRISKIKTSRNIHGADREFHQTHALWTGIWEVQEINSCSSTLYNRDSTIKQPISFCSQFQLA